MNTTFTQICTYPFDGWWHCEYDKPVRFLTPSTSLSAFSCNKVDARSSNPKIDKHIELIDILVADSV